MIHLGSKTFKRCAIQVKSWKRKRESEKTRTQKRKNNNIEDHALQQIDNIL